MLAQKIKQRDADRSKKLQRRQSQSNTAEPSSELMVEMESQSKPKHHVSHWLPWTLLLLTWVGLASDGGCISELPPVISDRGKIQMRSPKP